MDKKNNEKMRDSYLDDLNRALLYSGSIILIMWIMSFIIK